MKFLVALCFAICGIASAYDEDIQISDLSGCREIRLNGRNNNEWTVPISSLSNIKMNPNETFRMKLFAIGYDFNIYFKEANNSVKFLATITGWNRSTCGLCIGNDCNIPFAKLTQVDCTNLTNSFYYTEFQVVITKGEFFFFWNTYINFYSQNIFQDGFLEFFKDKEEKTFMFANIGSEESISQLSFGRFQNETVDTRLLFDCPNPHFR